MNVHGSLNHVAHTISLTEWEPFEAASDLNPGPTHYDSHLTASG